MRSALLLSLILTACGSSPNVFDDVDSGAHPSCRSQYAQLLSFAEGGDNFTLFAAGQTKWADGQLIVN